MSEKIEYECTGCGERCFLVAEFDDDGHAEYPEIPTACPWGLHAPWKIRKGAGGEEE